MTQSRHEIFSYPFECGKRDRQFLLNYLKEKSIIY